ncbi:MAG: phosphopantothenoylcysteine decarboxylase [Planctomycetota bacterium]|nr:phosphopantothenoylcysteine decarboxylase [Planctomycetota bacterium]
MLITAGPTHEPIDAVRYIGNRSSGKMGVALADAAARAGWNVTLALGPVASRPEDSHVRVIQFRTASDLDTILTREHDHFDVLVMAAAVADYRPKVDPAMANAKFRRTDQSMTLQLEPTPDLIAGVGKRRRPGQFLVAFALEPRDEMIASGRAKMQRKNVDMVVANPLGTMDSDGIEGVVLLKDGRELRPASAHGTLKKDAFAAWLITQIDREAAASASPSR